MGFPRCKIGYLGTCSPQESIECHSLGSGIVGRLDGIRVARTSLKYVISMHCLITTFWLCGEGEELWVLKFWYSASPSVLPELNYASIINCDPCNALEFIKDLENVFPLEGTLRG